MPKVKIKGYKKIAEVLIHWQIFLIIQKILTVLFIILQQQIFCQCQYSSFCSMLIYFAKPIGRILARFCFFPVRRFFFSFMQIRYGYGITVPGRLHFCQSGLVLNNSLRTHWHGVTWMNEMRPWERRENCEL